MTTSAATLAQGVSLAAQVLTFEPTGITPPATQQDAHAAIRASLDRLEPQITSLQSKGLYTDADARALDQLAANISELDPRLTGGDLDVDTVRDVVIVLAESMRLTGMAAARVASFQSCQQHGGEHDACVTSALALATTPSTPALPRGGAGMLLVAGAALAVLAAGAAVVYAQKRGRFLNGFNNPRPVRLVARPQHRRRRDYQLEIE